MSLRPRASAVLLGLVIAVTACVDARSAFDERTSEPTPPAQDPNVHGPSLGARLGVASPVLKGPLVLVTIDGVRWQEIFRGTDPAFSQAPAVQPPQELVPNLWRIATHDGAAVGAEGYGVMASSGPNFVSLPGYIEIFTGRARTCGGNDCPQTTIPTFLDDAHTAGAKVAAFGSWEVLERAVTRQPNPSRAPGGFVVSCGRAGDPDIDPSPGHGDYRPDVRTADAALAYLAQEQPDILYVGLGDPDEHAHAGNYDAYLYALRQADDVVGRIEATLATMGERGRATSLVVTADHGREAAFRNHGGFAPESARVWMIAEGPVAGARGFVRSPRERHLADIAPTLRRVLGLPRPPHDPQNGVVLDELVGHAARGRQQGVSARHGHAPARE